MPNKQHRRTYRVVIGTILGITLTVPAIAEDSQRGQRWQFTLPITFTNSESLSGEEGSTVNVADDLGWGFGFAYHKDERLMFGLDFTWLSTNYRGTFAIDNDGNQIPDGTGSINGVLDASTMQGVVQFNILASNVTPFVRGGLGVTWVDTNIPAGPGFCWWDPWWGYICDQPTFEDSVFSYGAAAGIRADINERFFLEGSYQLLWLDLDRGDTPSLDGWRLNIGWMH